MFKSKLYRLSDHDEVQCFYRSNVYREVETFLPRNKKYRDKQNLRCRRDCEVECLPMLLFIYQTCGAVFDPATTRFGSPEFQVDTCLGCKTLCFAIRAEKEPLVEILTNTPKILYRLYLFVCCHLLKAMYSRSISVFWPLIIQTSTVLVLIKRKGFLMSNCYCKQLDTRRMANEVKKGLIPHSFPVKLKEERTDTSSNCDQTCGMQNPLHPT